MERTDATRRRRTRRRVPTLLCLVVISTAGLLLGSSTQMARGQQATLRAQVAASLKALHRAAPTLTQRWSRSAPRPTLLRGLHLTLPGDTLQARAQHFLRRYPKLLVSTPAALTLTSQRKARGTTVLSYAQRHRGIPVDGAVVTLAFDALGRLRAAHSSACELRLADVKAKISALAAKRAAHGGLHRPGKAPPRALAAGKAELRILPRGGGHLVYAVTLPLTLDPAGRLHLIDAKSGRYLARRRGILWHRGPQHRGGRR